MDVVYKINRSRTNASKFKCKRCRHLSTLSEHQRRIIEATFPAGPWTILSQGWPNWDGWFFDDSPRSSLVVR